MSMSIKQGLQGKVALVAGATRGAGRGIAVQLGAAGATVYVTGRSTRSARSEMNRPETIEETAALVDAVGGRVALPGGSPGCRQTRRRYRLPLSGLNAAITAVGHCSPSRFESKPRSAADERIGHSECR